MELWLCRASRLRGSEPSHLNQGVHHRVNVVWVFVLINREREKGEKSRMNKRLEEGCKMMLWKVCHNVIDFFLLFSRSSSWSRCVGWSRERCRNRRYLAWRRRNSRVWTYIQSRMMPVRIQSSLIYSNSRRRSRRRWRDLLICYRKKKEN